MVPDGFARIRRGPPTYQWKQSEVPTVPSLTYTLFKSVTRYSNGGRSTQWKLSHYKGEFIPGH